MSFEDIKKHVEENNKDKRNKYVGQNNNITRKNKTNKPEPEQPTSVEDLEKEMMERDDRHPENSTLEKNAGEIEIAPMIDPEREGM